MQKIYELNKKKKGLAWNALCATGNNKINKTFVGKSFRILGHLIRMYLCNNK